MNAPGAAALGTGKALAMKQRLRSVLILRWFGGFFTGIFTALPGVILAAPDRLPALTPTQILG